LQLPPSLRGDQVAGRFLERQRLGFLIAPERGYPIWRYAVLCALGTTVYHGLPPCVDWIRTSARVHGNLVEAQAAAGHPALWRVDLGR
jgi:hypothetical protein